MFVGAEMGFAVYGGNIRKHCFVVLYCNFRSLAFLGLLGFLIRQLKVCFFTTLLSAAKIGLPAPLETRSPFCRALESEP